MRPIYHFILSIVPAAVVYYYFNFFYFAIILVMGVIPDIDHVIDYWYHLGIQPVEVSDKYYFETGKIYVVLHSYELIFVLFILAYLFNNSLLFFINLGLCIHVMFDTIHNYVDRDSNSKERYLFYFFMFRYLNKFEHKSLCSHRY